MSHSRAVAWTIWIIASVFYAYQYVLRLIPNVMFDEIMKQFNLDAATFGQIAGIYYIGYAFMHLPLGILLDKYGPRKVMSACILMSALSVTPILFATHWIFPLVGRLLLGIGSSAAILGAFKIIRMSFKESQFTRMLSFSVTIGLLGAIYGGTPVSFMTQKLGYLLVIQIFTVSGIALALFTYLIVPEMEKTQTSSVLSDLKEVLGNKKVIWFSFMAGLMVGPLEGFSDVWGSAFFKHAYNFDSVLAATLPSLIFVGMSFGGPILSFIAEKTGRYTGTISGAAIVMSLTFFSLLSGKMMPETASLAMIIIGVCCAYQILAVYKASTYVNGRVAGITTAVANMIIMVFGYGFHSAIGLVMKATGGPNSAKAYVYGVAVIPVALVISALGLIALMYSYRKKSTARC